MAVFSRIKTWVSNEVLTAADLNAEFNNLLNNMDPEGIEDASATVSDMQATSDPGGVGTESQATDLLGEIKRLRYKIKQLMDGAQWYSTPVGSLSTGGIVTGNLAANAVTREKLVSVGQQISSSCGSFTTTSASYVDVTNLSVSITTTGRPVVIFLQSASGATNPAYGSTTANAKVRIVRDSTEVALSLAGSGIQHPPGGLMGIDVPSAGTYTYKVQALSSSGTAFVQTLVLVAYEL